MYNNNNYNNNNKMSLFTSALSNPLFQQHNYCTTNLPVISFMEKRWYVALPCTNACFSKQGGSCFLCFVLSINCNVDCMSRTLRIGWNACSSESIVKKLYTCCLMTVFHMTICNVLLHLHHDHWPWMSLMIITH